MSANGSRLPGIFVNSSEVMLVVVPVALRSTSGVAAVTVTISLRPTVSDTGSSTFFPDLHDESFANECAEPVEVDRQLVRAGREIQKAKRSGPIGQMYERVTFMP